MYPLVTIIVPNTVRRFSHRKLHVFCCTPTQARVNAAVIVRALPLRLAAGFGLKGPRPALLPVA